MSQAADSVIHDVRVPSLFWASGSQGLQDGAYMRGDMVIRDERAVDLLPGARTPNPRMVIPKLVEAHCHLDKCHSIHRLGTVGGDLLSAIAAQGRDKENWTADDLTDRARKGLSDCTAAGCGVVRSHIDWDDIAARPLAWDVLTQLDADGLALQWAALTGIDHMANTEFATEVARIVASAPGGVLGSFVLDQPAETIQQGLRHVFDRATKHGLAIDFHVDETLQNFDGVEAIADMALETGFEGPILCGHAVALASKSEDDVARIADKLAKANITICALPTTNLYLQSRNSGTPLKRGITRLRELHDRGVPVIVGSDNVADAFCPLGQHDPMAALHLTCLTAHLDPPLDRWLRMVTTDAARALGLAPPIVQGAALSDLMISDAQDTASLIAGRQPLTPLVPHSSAKEPA